MDRISIAYGSRGGAATGGGMPHDPESERTAQTLQENADKAEKEYLAAKMGYQALRPRKGGHMTPALTAAARHYARSRRAYRKSIEALLAFHARHDSKDC